MPAGGIVWLTLTNGAFLDFARNWAAHALRLRKGHEMLIAGLDAKVVGALLAEGLPTFHVSRDGVDAADVRSHAASFRALGAIKAELVLRVIGSGRQALLSDIDVVWASDPAPILADLHAADLGVSTDCLSPRVDAAIAARPPDGPPITRGIARCAYAPGNRDGHSAFNSGIVWLRPTAAAAAAAAGWRARLTSAEENKWLDDQLALNELIWWGLHSGPKGEIVGAVGGGGRVVRVRTDQRHGADGPVGATLKRGWAELLDSGYFRNRSGHTPIGHVEAAHAPDHFSLAPLPAAHFCSGHVFFVQQVRAPACPRVIIGIGMRETIIPTRAAPPAGRRAARMPRSPRHVYRERPPRQAMAPP